MMHAESVDEYVAALGEIHAVDPVVFGEGMRERQWCDGPPAMCLFDAGGDVRKSGEILPRRAAVFTDDSVKFGLGFLKDSRPLGHGVDESDDETRSCVGTALHNGATEEIDRMLVETQLLALVENPIEETVATARVFSPFHHILDPFAIQRRHFLPHILRARSPHSQKLFRNPVQKGKDIHGWRIPRFHDLGPVLH